ncbi:hypothetical protein PSHT_09341 [Puccinia striiformis]|uniref:C2H2-type domain-containing protein n=3 Tax=Puccinia striiformis TaxID=27350 RepID=A0A2S4VHD3_9BASI|nr:hypothetical protein PSHT_09341 [Puccinia striiformis]
MSDHLNLPWQNMSFGDDLQYHHHTHHHPNIQQQQHHQQHQQHHYQSDAFQSDVACNNPNQLPLDPPPPLIAYEFQVPMNLFTSQPLPSFSPGSSSCRSSSSSNHSLFNSHHQVSSIQDHQHRSPTPLHASYLTSSLDLGQATASKALDRSTLLGCPSRDSRSGSVSSEPSTNWPVPQGFDLQTEPFELLRWEDQDCRWELHKFGDDRGHERSRSEGDVMPGSRFQAAGESLEPSFDITGGGTGDYSTGRRNLSRGWPTDDRVGEEENAPFDPTRSKFMLSTHPTSEHKMDGLRPTCSVTAEGPVMASFALPPGNQHEGQMLAHEGSRHQNSDDLQPLSAMSSSEFHISPSTATGTGKAKKTPNRTPRTGNNGGRCRRLAPANRECHHCGAKFTRNDRLNYHIDSIHEHKEPKFKCDVVNCSRAFRQRSDLVRHSRHVHHKF